MPQLNDWHQKRDFLFRVFHWADSMPKLVEEMFKGMEFDDPNVIPKFTDTAQRWKNNLKPNTPMASTFFESIAVSLSCDEYVTSVMLMESNYGQFVKLVPEKNRTDGIGLGPVPATEVLVEDLTEEEIADLDDEILATIDTSMFPIEVFEYDPGQNPSVRAAAVDGLLDQRLFYHHPDSAEHWESIITAQQYPTFNKCKFSLDRLWADKSFKKEISTTPPNRVVMLGGGGAFSKDVALISELVNTGAYCSQSRLNYALLDVSTPMLRRSRLRLGLNWRNTDWGHRVNIELIAGDFMFLHRKQRRERLRRDSGRVMWALTGGTIGNVSEGRFFSSLNRVSATGDLLVLSASVLNEGVDVEKSNDADTNKYLSPAVKALLRSPVQDLISHLKSRASVDRVLSSLKPDFREGNLMGITDVPNSHTVVLSAKIRQAAYDVFNHTHYNEESLKMFAASNGWTCKKTISPGYGEPDFAQFFFERTS